MAASTGLALVAIALISAPLLVAAHLGAWTEGMFCPDNTHQPVMKDSGGGTRFIDPLFQMEKQEWWFQHGRGCDRAMPRGFLSIPANDEFTANISDTKGGAVAGVMAAGRNSEAEFQRSAEGCIYSPNMHTKSKSTAAGTAFAIAYVSNIDQVTPENLVVFSVAPNTPYERIARYQVPDLAACPEAGCICAWGWIPDGCGQQNMYMQGHKCRVTKVSATGKRPGKAAPPGPNVAGPKQMIFAFQKSGNNVPDRTPSNQVPTYSNRMGFLSGAQTDIFDEAGADDDPGVTPSPSTPASTPATKCRVRPT